MARARRSWSTLKSETRQSRGGLCAAMAGSAAGRLIQRRGAALSCGRFPPLEPPAKRLLRFTRSAARKETLHTDIFIEFRPVDPLAARNETPVGALGCGPVRQAREPCEWRRDCPAVRQVHNQRIIAYTYTLCECFPEFSPRSTHAMPSTTGPRFPRPAFRFVRFPPLGGADHRTLWSAACGERWQAT
jgi:hypothetical protein